MIIPTAESLRLSGEFIFYRSSHVGERASMSSSKILPLATALRGERASAERCKRDPETPRGLFSILPDRCHPHWSEYLPKNPHKGLPKDSALNTCPTRKEPIPVPKSARVVRSSLPLHLQFLASGG